MTRPSVGCLVCAVGPLLVVGSSAYAQSNATAADHQVQAVAREATAASIVAREEAASGRRFDPGFRAQVVRNLASLSQAELDAIQSQDGGVGTSALGGDGQADLVFVPVTPCRIIDTRVAGGQIGAGATRSFSATGSGFTGQGGTSGSCGVPVGPATAVAINFVAVSPAGPGHLSITPYGTAMPNASFLNYALPGTGLNIANALVAGICNPATTTCTYDFTILAEPAAVQVVADVMGFFRKVSIATGSDQISSTTPAASTYVFGTTQVSLPNSGTCLVTCEVDIEQSTNTAGSFLNFKPAMHAVVAGTNTAGSGWGNDVPNTSFSTSATATRAFGVAANTAYTFGCYWAVVGGDFASVTAYPTANWVCR